MSTTIPHPNPKALALTMAALAVSASNPGGPQSMGWLHFTPGSGLTDADKLWIEGLAAKYNRIELDYVNGRMVKFGVQITPEGVMHRGFCRPDYQAWSVTYPTYEDLAKAAAALLEQTPPVSA